MFVALLSLIAKKSIYMSTNMNKGELSTFGNKLERKIIEKNRRLCMKYLCHKLLSVIPPDHFNPAKEFLSQQDQIEQATNYIKTLRERIEELKRKKRQYLAQKQSQDCNNNGGGMGGAKLPILKIRDSGSSLEVVLISGIMKKIMLNQVISIIEQEGAEVVDVNLSTIGDKIFHTLHAKVKFSRVGMDTMKMGERLQELI